MFTIADNEFLDEFYKYTKEYTYSCFQEINHSILNNSNNFYSHFFSEIEIATIIVLNKSFFQNITGFFELIDSKLPIPAFNALRAAVEAMRLFRAFFIDEELRKDYIKNENTDFRSTPDYNFMQKRINKVLDEKEKELKSKDKVPLSFILSNHNLTKGSAISDLHSELSKWSHLLNINLLMPAHLNNARIYLGIDDEYDDRMQFVIKKYIEGVFLIVSFHEDTFTPILFRKEHQDIRFKMLEMYSQYIELFY